MWIRFLTWLASWLTARAIEESTKYGSLTLQQTRLEHGWGWTSSLRAHQEGGGPRYAWTGSGDTIAEAVMNVVKEARDESVIRQIVAPSHAPKLGGKEFDE